MKSHRALSSVVGAVFLIAIVLGALSYITYSLEIMGSFSEALITEESRIKDKQREAFEITSIDITTANKLDGVIKNIGEIPVKLTTLWVDEQGVNDVVQKFTLNAAISPGSTVNLITLADVDIDPTKGYNMKVVTSRGEVNSFFVNSPNQQALDLQLYSLPQTIPDEFKSTLLLSVHNNGTSEQILMNIKPVDPLAIAPNDVNTIVTYIDGPIPTSFPSLKSGDTAIFKWTYSIKGDTNDYADFTAQLENGYTGNTATARITIGEVKLATDAVTAFTSQGFNPLASQSQDLVLHQESLPSPFPSNAYQMDQKIADASGLSLLMNTVSTPPDFYTNNGTVVEISPGIWNASLTYISDPLPDSLSTSMDSKGGMIFHFEDGGAGIENENSDEDNSMDCKDGTKGRYLTYQGGLSSADWNKFGGPQGSGSYTFDGTSDFFYVEDAKCNEVKREKATIAGWFKSTSSGSGSDYIYWLGKDDGATSKNRFAVFINTNDKLVFEFETDGNNEVSCISPGNYRDDLWHHFVGVRDADYSCVLYIDGTSVVTDSTSGSDDEIKEDKYPLIGARLTTKDTPQGGDFFEGSIDDIMFWQKYALSSTQVTDLYNTNYGNSAHTITYTLSRAAADGTNIATIRNDIAYPMNFSDGKRQGQFLKSFNYTTPLLPITTIGGQERLKFEMLFVDFTKALQMTLRTDDNALTTSPRSSYIDLPPINASFFPYNTYDNDAQFTVGVTSSGPFGTWLTQSGTRVILNNTINDISYAGIIKSVNATILNSTQDSIFIGVGDGVDLVFHRPNLSPNTCWPPSAGCDVGLVIPGLYNGQILMVGYNDEGNENTWKISLGNIQVDE